MKNLVILGSTGSIGTQSLEVAKNLGYNLVAISAYSNINLLEEQCKKYRPKICIVEEEYADDIKKRLIYSDTQVLSGEEAYETAIKSGDFIINAISGFAAFEHAYMALKMGKTVAMANKEAIVAAGEHLMRESQKNGGRIIPIDSEHSAIFQCLEQGNKVKKVILTASGGPFNGMKKAFLEGVTPEMATSHPTWKMGKKISVDSATMMNKGFEVIEAVRLFGLTPEQVEVIIHPQSIIHSMVEFEDGTIKALLSKPDMKLSIQYALTCPERKGSKVESLDFASLGSLTFEKPNASSYPLLQLAYDCISKGGNLPAALSAADEAAVTLFLEGRIGFLDIVTLVSEVCERVEYVASPSVQKIIDTDKQARKFVTETLFRKS